MAGESSNKIVPIIIGVLGVLYGISPVDILPDVVPVFGWVDDWASCKDSLKIAMRPLQGY